MSLKANFEIQNTEKVLMRLTVVMTVEDWGLVKSALKSDARPDHWHPANELVRSIDDLTRQAEKSFGFWGEPKPEPLP